MEEGGPPVIYELTAESAAGQRIDKYLSEQLADLSRSYLQKLLKDGGVEVNGKTVKSNYKLADKDQICFFNCSCSVYRIWMKACFFPFIFYVFS